MLDPLAPHTTDMQPQATANGPDTASAQQTRDTNSSRPHDSGDTVSISDAARTLAEASGMDAYTAEAVEEFRQSAPGPEAVTETVVNTTTASGKTIVIDKITVVSESVDPATMETRNTSYFSYRASIYGQDDKLELSLDLDQDMILTEDGNGNYTMASPFKPGQGTSGNDIIIGRGGVDMDGGAGDDILISLGSPSYTSTMNTKYSTDSTTLKGGSGDDTIIVIPTITEVHIDAGDGDDVVDTSAGPLVFSTIETGDGNDTVRARGMLSSSIHTGDGDDVVTMSGGMVGGVLDTGDGDDVVGSSLKNGGASFSVVDISTGRGNDRFTSEALIGSSLDLGEGDDTAVIGDVRQSTIHAGDGDDSLDMGNLYRSKVDAGWGDDSLTFKNAYHSIIDTGIGNDRVRAMSLYASLLDTGAGDDDIEVEGTVSDSHVYTGGGEDKARFIGTIENSTLDMGEDNDSLYLSGTISNSRIHLGGGNDSLRATGELEDNAIYGGSGSDDVLLAGTLNSNQVFTGQDSDTVRLEGQATDNLVGPPDPKKDLNTAQDRPSREDWIQHMLLNRPI